MAAGAAEGGYAYTRYFAPAATPQHVVVFISGINAGTKSCFNDTFGNSRLFLLAEQAGITDPYTNGCAITRDMRSAATSMFLYGYVGGHMDTAHGVWIPNDYDACNVNDLTLQSDVQGLDHLLDQYRQVYPSATFTLVGHSLGGLVALQGAYDYTIALHHAGVVNKVVTLDAPLGGIKTSYWGQIGSGILTWLQQQTCVGPLGTVVDSDIPTLGDATATAATAGFAIACANPAVEPQVVLSACAARALAQAGVGVVTLGNQQDGLYCNPALAAARTTICASQNLSTQAPVLGHLDNLTPLADDTGFFAGHGTILNDPTANNEVMRAILAPVVTIAQPSAGASVSATSTGVAISYSATVHCLWGPAQHATAFVAAAGSQRDLFAGTASRSSDSSTLNLNGVVSLPSSLSAAAMRFYVDASGSACGYPAGAKFQPTAKDYYGGAEVPVAFTVAQGGSASTAPTQPSNPSDAAFMLAASPEITADAGDTFTAYFDELNAGNTTWSDAGGYQLVCDASAPDNNCMGGQPTGLNGAQVAPGQQATVYVSFTAPGTAGTYKTAWMMGLNGRAFGQGTAPVTATVKSAPIVFMATFDGAITALRSTNGHILWHFAVKGQSSYIGPLLVSGNLLYIFSCNSADHTVPCPIDAIRTNDGTLAWEQRFGGGCLTVLGGVLYTCSSDGYLYALDAQSGAQRWRAQLLQGAEIWNFTTISMSGGIAYVAYEWPNDGTVEAFDIATGRLLWRYDSGEQSADHPLVAGNDLYVVTGAGGYAGVGGDSETIRALRTADGSQIWSYAVNNPGNDPSIHLSNGTLLFSTGDDVDALDLQTGGLRWRVPDIAVDSFEVVGAEVYVFDEDGNVQALNAVTGTSIWLEQFSTLADQNTLVYADNTLYVLPGSYGEPEPLYAVDPGTGKVRWVYSPASIDERPSYAADVKVFGCDFALSAVDGKTVWQQPAVDCGAIGLDYWIVSTS